jgi:hypothetical protein
MSLHEITMQNAQSLNTVRASREEGIIEMHVNELNQLFNSLDPSPFFEKELDRNAEENLVRSAQDLPAKSPKAVVVVLSKPSGIPAENQLLSEAIHAHFSRQGRRLRRQLRALLRRGWLNLGIGLTFLAACLIGGQIALRFMGDSPVARVIQESLLICGWVAMWNPLEIFLYDWWPILSLRRLYDRLSKVRVHIMYSSISSFR